MADDSRFLNSLNGSTGRYGATRIFFGDYVEEIQKGWNSVGIKAYAHCGYSNDYDNINRYYLNGEEITQEEARQHAMKVTGHYMTESDWNW